MPGFDNSSNLLYINVYGDISGDYINVGTKLNVIGETDISNLTVKGSATFKKNITVEKDITIEGNFTVKGTDTFIHTTNTDICDNIITLNKGATDSGGDAANNSGIIINRGTDASNVFMGWKDDRFILGKTNADGSTVTISTIDPVNLYVKDVSMNKLDVSGNIYVKGDIIPSENSSNIGTEDKYYEKTYTKSLYVEKNSIFFKQQSSNVSDASCVKISVSNDELYLTRPNKGINKLGMDEDYVFGIPPKPTNPTNDIAGTTIKLNWTPIEQKMSSWGTKLPFINRIAIDISGEGYDNWTRIKEITGNDDISFTFVINTNYTVNNENHRIIKDTSYNFRVYGENSLTTEQTAKYLLFTDMSTLPIGPPNDPSFVSFTNITQTSVQLNATAPTDNDTNMVGNQTEPVIKKYKISYNATSAPQRYGEIYTGSHINNFETGDDNTAIDISNLYPGTTYDISFAAKNVENVDYGAFSDISAVTTLIPEPFAVFNNSNTILGGTEYYSLSTNTDVSGVFKHSQKGNKTAFSNITVRLNIDDKIGISCEDIVSTFELRVSKIGSDISGFTNISGFNEPEGDHNVSVNNGTLDVSFATLTIGNTVDAGTDASSGFYINGDISLNVDITNASNGEEYTVTLSSTSEGIGEQIRTFYVDDLSGVPVVSNIVMNTPVIDVSSTYFGITSVDTATITIDASINNFANYFVNTNNRIAEMKLTIGNNLDSSFNTYNGGTNPGEINITNSRQYTKGSSSTYLGEITGQVRGLSINTTTPTPTFTDSSTNELIYSDPSNNPGTNIMKPGTGQFPSEVYTQTYDHATDIPDNQLMYVNNLWRSGGNNSIAFKDYSTTMENSNKNYISKEDSGDIIDNINYKWAVLYFPNAHTLTTIQITGITNLVNNATSKLLIRENTGVSATSTEWRNLKLNFQLGGSDPYKWGQDAGAKMTDSNNNLYYQLYNYASPIYIRIGLPWNSTTTFGTIGIDNYTPSL